ncbi:MAG: hypothetical protein KAT05_08550 [Spirochaetes bacterium]|nr:hypothetical protein [Spirochaetota bacterium]
MDPEITVAVIIALVGVPTAVLVSDVFGKYEKKILPIRTALLGLLDSEKDKLVERENFNKNINKANERDYNDLINFLKDSNFLRYADEYEEILHYEANGEEKLNKLAVSIGGLSVPVILFQQQVPYQFIGLVWFIINFALFAVFATDAINMTKYIRRLYNSYILEKQSFGGYDL